MHKSECMTTRRSKDYGSKVEKLNVQQKMKKARKRGILIHKIGFLYQFDIRSEPRTNLIHQASILKY